MREKLFTLTRSQRDDLWRRYKHTTDRRVAERLHAILLLDEGRSAPDVSAILHLHPKTLKRWVKLFAASGVDGLCPFNYVGGDGWLTNDHQQQFMTWLDADVRSTAAEFRTVVQSVLNNIAAYRDEMVSLMTERFQLFTAP